MCIHTQTHTETIFALFTKPVKLYSRFMIISASWLIHDLFSRVEPGSVFNIEVYAFSQYNSCQFIRWAFRVIWKRIQQTSTWKRSNVPLTDMHFVDIGKVCCIWGRRKNGNKTQRSYENNHNFLPGWYASWWLSWLTYTTINRGTLMQGERQREGQAEKPEKKNRERNWKRHHSKESAKSHLKVRFENRLLNVA